MSLQLITKTKVGKPIRHGGVTIFPLFLGSNRGSGAVVADDALQVSELDSATVPQLQVTNLKDVPVIIPAGRVLEGGRQTRTVNVSILVPAGATITIPVSCVEAGRWHGGSQFRDSKRVAGRNVRMAKQRGVKRNIDSYGQKSSDQGAVWRSIDAELSSRSLHHEFSSYMAADSFVETDETLYATLSEFMKEPLAPGQTGIAVAYGNKVAGVEVFTNPDDLSRSWETLVRSAVLDSPQADEQDITIDVADIEKFLADVAAQEETEAHLRICRDLISNNSTKCTTRVHTINEVKFVSNPRVLANFFINHLRVVANKDAPISPRHAVENVFRCFGCAGGGIVAKTFGTHLEQDA
jgi:hypothetical protein